MEEDMDEVNVDAGQFELLLIEALYSLDFLVDKVAEGLGVELTPYDPDTAPDLDMDLIAEISKHMIEVEEMGVYRKDVKDGINIAKYIYYWEKRNEPQ